MSQEYKQQLLTSTYVPYVPGTEQDNYKCFSMDSLKEFFKVHKVGIRLFFFSGEEMTQSIKLPSKIIQLINSRVKTGTQVCLSKKKNSHVLSNTLGRLERSLMQSCLPSHSPLGTIRRGKNQSKWKIYTDFHEAGNGKIIK